MANDESNTLQLPTALDIYGSAEVRGLLIREIAARDEIALDLSQVESCDTAGVQVLLAARRTAQQSGKLLHITQISDAVIRTGESLGLSIAELKGSSQWNPNS